jgi:hypothetical protein
VTGGSASPTTTPGFTTPGFTDTTTPSFTDTTLSPPIGTTPVLTDDECAGSDSTFTHSRVTMSVVNPPGYWTLVFADGLCAPHNYSTTCITYDVAYSVTLTVRHFTQTVVAFPATAPLGRQVTLSGRVIGMTGGYVYISTQRKGKWIALGLSPLGVNGIFSRVVRLPRERGRYPYRVTFFGDQEHRPSGRTVTIRVG